MKLRKIYSSSTASPLPYPPDPWTCEHGNDTYECRDDECVAFRNEREPDEPDFDTEYESNRAADAYEREIERRMP